MDISPWVEAFQEQLDGLSRKTQNLTDLIKHESGFVFCSEKPMIQLIDEGEFNWKCIEGPEAARLALCEHLERWGYDDQRRVMVACAQVGCETIEVARELNELKERWESFHYYFRTIAGNTANTQALPKPRFPKQQVPTLERSDSYSEELATKRLGEVLKCVKRIDSPLSLDATDRKIQILEGPAIQIAWYTQTTRPSTRKPLSLVIELAQKHLLNTQGADRDMAEVELAKLQGMPSDTMVAYCPKRPVSSVRYRASSIVGNQHQKAVTGYAVNPVLFPYGGYEPDLNLFQPKRQTDNPGRPVTISDRRVSSFVPHFYWYKQRETATTTKKAPGKKKNPYAATSFPGIWLAARRRKTGWSALVMVKVPGRASTSFSIGRDGLENAWRKAGKIYCSQNNVLIDDLLRAAPPTEQVDRMLDWASSHG